MTAAYKIPPALGLVTSLGPGAGGAIVAVCPQCKAEHDADDFAWLQNGPAGQREYDEGHYRFASRTCTCNAEVRRVVGVSLYTTTLSRADVARFTREARGRLMIDECAGNWNAAADSTDEYEAMWAALVTKCDGDEDWARRLMAMVEL